MSVERAGYTLRARVFVDLSNLELSVSQYTNGRHRLDWTRFPQWLVEQAEQKVLPGQQGDLVFEGCFVYMSFNPNKDTGRKMHNWAMYTLGRISGVQVKCHERRPKRYPICPHCHKPVTVCPDCRQAFDRTEEKGVDTSIVTDLLKFAWEGAYDIAVLVSSDADFVPAVEFLTAKGKRIIQAGFPPAGAELARVCWASLDLRPNISEVFRDGGS